MIHELRNPLNSVIGGIDLLSQSRCLSVDDKKNLKIAQHSAEILMSLIGNVLDVAKLEAQKVELDYQYVYFKDAFNQVIDLLQFKAQEKKIKLQHFFANEVPPYIQIDQARLTQILLNLLSNSIKFTQRGYVRVSMNFLKGSLKGSPRQYFLKRNSAPDQISNESSRNSPPLDLINPVITSQESNIEMQDSLNRKGENSHELQRKDIARKIQSIHKSMSQNINLQIDFQYEQIRNEYEKEDNSKRENIIIHSSQMNQSEQNVLLSLLNSQELQQEQEVDFSNMIEKNRIYKPNQSFSNRSPIIRLIKASESNSKLDINQMGLIQQSDALNNINQTEKLESKELSMRDLNANQINPLENIFHLSNSNNMMGFPISIEEQSNEEEDDSPEKQNFRIQQQSPIFEVDEEEKELNQEEEQKEHLHNSDREFEMNRIIKNSQDEFGNQIKTEDFLEEDINENVKILFKSFSPGCEEQIIKELQKDKQNKQEQYFEKLYQEETLKELKSIQQRKDDKQILEEEEKSNKIKQIQKGKEYLLENSYHNHYRKSISDQGFSPEKEEFIDMKFENNREISEQNKKENAEIHQKLNFNQLSEEIKEQSELLSNSQMQANSSSYKNLKIPIKSNNLDDVEKVINEGIMVQDYPSSQIPNRELLKDYQINVIRSDGQVQIEYNHFNHILETQNQSLQINIQASNQQDQNFPLSQIPESEDSKIISPSGEFQVSPIQKGIRKQFQDRLQPLKINIDQFQPRSDYSQAESETKNQNYGISKMQQYLSNSQHQVESSEYNGDILHSLSPSPNRKIPQEVPKILTDPKQYGGKLVQGVLQITIQDTGIGISDEDQNKLFQPFQQANKTIQTKFGGTGLGLWITSKILELMKGNIALKSLPNVGTTFTLRIPAEGVYFEERYNQNKGMLYNNNSVGGVSQYTKLETNFHKLSLLILIQDEFNKEILRKFLLKLQCPMTFAFDFDDFIEKLNYVHRFNVFIVDADQFSLSQNSVLKTLIRHKKQVEFRTNKMITLLVLSTLDLDSRQKLKYSADRVILFRKPVKSETLKICLTEISKREKSLMPFLILRDQRSRSMRNMKKQMLLGIGSSIKEERSKSGSFRKDQQHSSLLNSYDYSIKKSPNSRQVQQQLMGDFSSGIDQSIQTPVFSQKGGTTKKQSKILDIEKLNKRLQERRSERQNQKEDSLLSEERKSNQIQSLNSFDKDQFKKKSKDDSNFKQDQNFLQVPYNMKAQKFNSHSQRFDSDVKKLIKMHTFNSRTILIVDDEDFNREILESQLKMIELVERNQIQIITARNGLEAVQIYKTEATAIQLIFTDLNMPEMDGKEASSQIRDFEVEQNIDPRVHIVGITGFEVNSALFKKQYSYQTCGINEFLTKPIKLQVLEKIVNEVYKIQEF